MSPKETIEKLLVGLAWKPSKRVRGRFAQLMRALELQIEKLRVVYYFEWKYELGEVNTVRLAETISEGKEMLAHYNTLAIDSTPNKFEEAVGYSLRQISRTDICIGAQIMHERMLCIAKQIRVKKSLIE